MKLATVRRADTSEALAAIVGDDAQVVLLQDAAMREDGAGDPAFASLQAFIEAGPAARERAGHLVERAVADRATLPLDELSLLSPLPRPQQMRDCMAFEAHVLNCVRRVGLGSLGRLDAKLERFGGRRKSLAGRLSRTWYERPLWYKTNRFSVVGHGAEIVMPRAETRFDYELEWAIVIGKAGRDIPAARAHEHIAGYMIFNDFSARDIQMAEMKGRLGPAKGKDFDTGNALGPWFVTSDMIPDPYALEMSARINGETWSQGTSADMHWSWADIVAHISRDETLHPGEVIGSGTCTGSTTRLENMGCGLEHGRFLKAGDVVELEVGGLGVLRNTVATPRPDRIA